MFSGSLWMGYDFMKTFFFFWNYKISWSHVDLANPWILIPLKVLQNFVSAKAKKIHLNNFYHPPTKFDGDTPCGRGHVFLVCDVTWSHKQRTVWLRRSGVLKTWASEVCWAIFLVSGMRWGFFGVVGGGWQWLGHYVG